MVLYMIIKFDAVCSQSTMRSFSTNEHLSVDSFAFVALVSSPPHHFGASFQWQASSSKRKCEKYAHFHILSNYQQSHKSANKRKQFNVYNINHSHVNLRVSVCVFIHSNNSYVFITLFETSSSILNS